MSTERPLEGKTALITGASRGIGREIALKLAEAGANIVGNSVDIKKQKRVEETMNVIRDTGANVIWSYADITTDSGREKLWNDVIFSKQGPYIDYLILNAAGGLEANMQEGWAEKINVESQLALLSNFRDAVNPEGAVIYLTSLWAHKFGEVKQPPFYYPVAKTKHLAERRLREMIPELQKEGIKVGFLCGHIITGTAAHSLMLRNFPDHVKRLEETAEGGKFPDASDMGNAAVKMLLSDFESGHTEYVGGTETQPLEGVKDKILTREEVEQKLPMYGPNKLLIDTFDTSANTATYKVRSDTSIYTPDIFDGLELFDDFDFAFDGKDCCYVVGKKDSEGHFANDFEEIKLFRGVDQVKIALRRLGLDYMRFDAGINKMPELVSLGNVKFIKMIFPDERITIKRTAFNFEADLAKGDCEIWVNDELAATVSNLLIKPSEDDSRTKLFEKTDMIEAAAQALGLSYLVNEQGEGLALFTSIGAAEFGRHVLQDEVVTLKPKITIRGGKSLTGNCQVLVGEELVGNIQGIELTLALNADMARRFVAKQKAGRSVKGQNYI